MIFRITRCLGCGHPFEAQNLNEIWFALGRGCCSRACQKDAIQRWHDEHDRPGDISVIQSTRLNGSVSSD